MIMKILDCTLRDGGYYNDWDFPIDVVTKYLESMSAAGVDIVELGLRSLKNNSFKGATAYTTDTYIRSLEIPKKLKVAVMVNAVELLESKSIESALEALFPASAADSPVDIIRIACHVHEFESALPSAKWLKNKGFDVGFNLMQVADRAQAEVEALSCAAQAYSDSIDALYFADSMGSMDPDQCVKIIEWLRTSWSGELGIHTHDNMGKALQNTLAALEHGVTWLDATVTGMGRGPGNARTEELVIEIAEHKGTPINLVPLMSIIRTYFQPLKNKCGWGTNPYYFLSGKYGIHPTYVQEMLGDTRFSEEDLLAVIEQLKLDGGKKFSTHTLNAARHVIEGASGGSWSPASLFEGKEVLLLGTGPGVKRHKIAIQEYIVRHKPVVAALNTQSEIDSSLINIRFACHPVRMIADCERHVALPQPLITPVALLSEKVKAELAGKALFDYGLEISNDGFEFGDTSCKSPTSLVMAYAFAALAAGKAKRIILAGFDGYESGDPRNEEMNQVVKKFQRVSGAPELIAITPSRYDVKKISVYGLC